MVAGKETSGHCRVRGIRSAPLILPKSTLPLELSPAMDLFVPARREREDGRPSRLPDVVLGLADVVDPGCWRRMRLARLYLGQTLAASIADVSSYSPFQYVLSNARDVRTKHLLLNQNRIGAYI